MEKAIIDRDLKSLEEKYSKEEIRDLAERFSKKGMVVLSGIIPDNIHKEIKKETINLLDQYKERIDLTLATTNHSPRKMNIVSHNNMLANADIIKKVYENTSLKKVLESITKSEMINYISDDEGLFISRQENPGDTHGWHWGDYSFALIFLLETPPIEVGGLLQCVAHTSWDKNNPRINQYLCDNKISTYGFKSGDIYLLKTDTTLHRTLPLKEKGLRIMLNMTWGTEADKLNHENTLNDTWWQNKDVEAANSIN